MKTLLLILAGIALLFVSGCQAPEPGCPPPSGTAGSQSHLPRVWVSPTPGPSPTPAMMTLGGRSVPVDTVVEGPLCDGTWRGIVYVTCNVQVEPWERRPTFLKDCDLTIEPGTVVYVAYHHDAAYYNGCSCHTGAVAGP